MICNAVHPQAEQLAVAGVTLEPCKLHEHPEGRHVFLTSAPVESVQLATIREVVTMTPADWRFNVQKNLKNLGQSSGSQRSYARDIERLAEMGELLGIPVGVVVRTYVEGGDDAA